MTSPFRDAGQRLTSLVAVSVIVPALNEAPNLPYFFERLPEDVFEVILVDGGSTDDTVGVAQDLYPSVVVVNQTRTGKGNALACGFDASKGDILVMVDADGSTDPAEMPLFINALVGGADYAKGSRFIDGGDSYDITRFRRFGNHGLNAVVNTLFGTKFTDLCYGYNAFWRSALDAFDLPALDLPRPADGQKLWGDGFEIETLINIRAAAHKLKIVEIPSIEARRIHGTSNLNAFGDGARVLRTIIREYRCLRKEDPAVRSQSADTGIYHSGIDPIADIDTTAPASPHSEVRNDEAERLSTADTAEMLHLRAYPISHNKPTALQEDA